MSSFPPLLPDDESNYRIRRHHGNSKRNPKRRLPDLDRAATRKRLYYSIRRHSKRYHTQDIQKKTDPFSTAHLSVFLLFFYFSFFFTGSSFFSWPLSGVLGGQSWNHKGLGFWVGRGLWRWTRVILTFFFPFSCREASHMFCGEAVFGGPSRLMRAALASHTSQTAFARFGVSTSEIGTYAVCYPPRTSHASVHAVRQLSDHTSSGDTFAISP
jgi:hypothetical protein